MGIKDLFKRKEKALSYQTYNVTYDNMMDTTNPFVFADTPQEDFQLRREQSREVYHKSIIAKNIVRRLTDYAINTGLTWESSPLWDMLKDAPTDTEERKKLTNKLEIMWRLYANSTEADYRNQLTLQKMQSLLHDLSVKEGEFFVIYKYLSDSSRLSNVTLQVLNNDQICQPMNASQLDAVVKRGGVVIDGVEFDSVGKEVAIYVQSEVGGDTTRIPFFGKTRRFVSHITNNPIRGKSRLSDIGCALKDIAEMDNSTIQSAKTQAKMSMVVTADKDAPRTNGGIKLPGVTDTNSDGVEEVTLEGEGFVFNKLPPGYDVRGFAPTLPNQNYEKFNDFKKQEMAGIFGLALSFLKIMHSSSYSAGRMETLQSWAAVIIFRLDFANSFLEQLKEVVFLEWNRAGDIELPGIEVKKTRLAWLYGSWNGISRPIVDPNREVNAIKTRQELGHTTGEAESKAYNGSDFYENTNRLKAENKELAEANKVLNETEPEELPENKEDDSDDEIKKGGK